MAKLLVAEDSATHAVQIQLILEALGHEVECVEDGQQALDRLAASEFDLVVTDLNMPILDGCELVKQMSSMYSSIPTVVVTARGSESLAVDALAAGATNFVPKNSMHSRLGTAVTQSLGYRKANTDFDDMQGRLKSPEFYFKITSDLSAIQPLAEYLVSTLAAARCGNAGMRYRIATAVASAIFNAIEYGNLQANQKRDDPAVNPELSDLAVRVKVSVAENDTRISVSHEGAGTLTPTMPAPGTPDSFEIEQARGMMLMTSFMDSVMFNGRHSEVTMVKQHPG